MRELTPEARLYAVTKLETMSLEKLRKTLLVQGVKVDAQYVSKSLFANMIIPFIEAEKINFDWSAETARKSGVNLLMLFLDIKFVWQDEVVIEDDGFWEEIEPTTTPTIQPDQPKCTHKKMCELVAHLIKTWQNSECIQFDEWQVVEIAIKQLAEYMTTGTVTPKWIELETFLEQLKQEQE